MAAAAELARPEPDVIAAGSAAAAVAVKRVARAIPIVFILVADPGRPHTAPVLDRSVGTD
jgi:hypothetical protein